MYLYFLLSCSYCASVEVCVAFFVFFFFKQKTAYEMRISDGSSDVCSSDLDLDHRAEPREHGRPQSARDVAAGDGGGGGLFAHRSAPSGLPARSPAAFALSPPCRCRSSGLGSPQLHKGARDMAEFRLPKNSRIQPGGTVHKAEGASQVKAFKVYRYKIGRANV